MNHIDMNQFFVLLDKAGQIPTRIDSALAQATERLAVNDVAAGRKHVTTAHTATAEIGATLAALEAWGKKVRDGEVTPTPTPPASNEPFVSGTLAAFNAWLPNSQQMVALDGIVVKSGFGPAAMYYTQTNGTISTQPRPITPVEVSPVETPTEIVLPFDPNKSYPANDPLPIEYNDFSRKLFKGDTQSVHVFKFVVPKGPYTGASGATLYGSVSENPSAPGGGQPAMRILTISRTPGDLSPNALVYSIGKQATCYMTCGVEAQSGETLYFNTIITEPFDRGLGSGFSIVWPKVD